MFWLLLQGQLPIYLNLFDLFSFTTDVAVGELLILSKKAAASLASWD